jgi:hypothetical protein
VLRGLETAQFGIHARFGDLVGLRAGSDAPGSLLRGMKHCEGLGIGVFGTTDQPDGCRGHKHCGKGRCQPPGA